MVWENGKFPSSCNKMNRNNKYTVPNFVGINKKGYSKQMMATANKRQQIEKRNQLRVMQKH
jgi:hypothetical protein